jgi:tellurite resistance protein TerC
LIPTHPLSVWIVFNLFIIVLLLFDLSPWRRRQTMTIGRAMRLSVGYFLLAMLFSVWVFYSLGHDAGIAFLTGYLIEKSLSVDNLFIFSVIFRHFSVPQPLQQRVLSWGIFGALVMRALIILLGTALIATFHWILFVFGGFLLFTGVKMLKTADSPLPIESNPLVLWLNRHIRVWHTFKDHHFFVYHLHQWWATPLVIVLITVEAMDLVFALDSIPAVFAVTRDPFIVYSSNVFAILGLRALYFALAGMLPRFRYLNYGLAFVLMLIGIKMIGNGYYHEDFIPTEIALLATVGLIGGSILISWRYPV